MDDELLKKYAYVISSTHRVKVMKGLRGDVLTPTQISKKIGFESKYVSKVLRELKLKELAECINEECRKGRLYRLTDDGEGVMEIFDEFGE